MLGVKGGKGRGGREVGERWGEVVAWGFVKKARLGVVGGVVGAGVGIGVEGPCALPKE